MITHCQGFCNENDQNVFLTRHLLCSQLGIICRFHNVCVFFLILYKHDAQRHYMTDSFLFMFIDHHIQRRLDLMNTV